MKHVLIHFFLFFLFQNMTLSLLEWILCFLGKTHRNTRWLELWRPYFCFSSFVLQTVITVIFGKFFQIILNRCFSFYSFLHPRDKILAEGPFNVQNLICLNNSLIAAPTISAIFANCFSQKVAALYYDISYINNVSDTSENPRFLSSGVYTSQTYFVSFNVFVFISIHITHFFRIQGLNIYHLKLSY